LIENRRSWDLLHSIVGAEEEQIVYETNRTRGAHRVELAKLLPSLSVWKNKGGEKATILTGRREAGFQKARCRLQIVQIVQIPNHDSSDLPVFKGPPPKKFDTDLRGDDEQIETTISPPFIGEIRHTDTLTFYC
jgi:hypothetical protein